MHVCTTREAASDAAADRLIHSEAEPTASATPIKEAAIALVPSPSTRDHRTVQLVRHATRWPTRISIYYCSTHQLTFAAALHVSAIWDLHYQNC